MMRCQRYQPFMSAIEKWGSADQQSASPLLGHPRECGIEVVFGIRGENNELDIQARGCLVHVSHLELSARISHGRGLQGWWLWVPSHAAGQAVSLQVRP